MFERIAEAPRDAILGLTETFREDPNPDKINLTVGVYKDASGATPTLESVRQAEARLVAELSSKAYLPIDGAPRYAEAVQQLLWSGLQPALEPGRAISSHTPGGTGALRVAADFIRANLEESAVWFTDPTWANHPNIFAAAGVNTDTIPYFDAAQNALDFDAFADGIRSIPPGDVLLLHGCCHNPTGVDPTPKQWRVLADLIRGQRILPLVDFAYQGFGEGLSEDATGLHTLLSKIPEMLIASSFSKNFGLYRERVGALTVVAETPGTARTVQSQIKRAIRANYSNPPGHGGAIVTTILEDEQLSLQWEQEVGQMRKRIADMRSLLVAKLAEHSVPGDFSFITNQRGMFSFFGITPDQVDRLRDEHSIYIVRSGRINVAGITEDNVDALCAAVARVVN